MHYLDVHAGSLQVVSSAVLVLITAVYTILTRTMAKAAREALRPYVYLDVLFASPVEMIVIVGNSGTKIASNVKATVIDSNSEKLKQLVSTLPLASGIGHLAPGGIRKYRLVAHPEDIFPETGPAPKLTFGVTYHDGSHLISDSQEIDLGGYNQSLFPWVNDSGYEIAKELKNIAGKMPSRTVSVFTTKLCPFCGTRLAESARKCHGCLEWLSGRSERSSNGRPHAVRPGQRRRHTR